MDSSRGCIHLPAVGPVRPTKRHSRELSRWILNIEERSAASSSRPKRPEALVFFIDRSLGRKKVPEALRAADHSKRGFIAKISRGPDVKIIEMGD